MSPLLTTYANGSARGYGAFSVAAAAGSFESIATVSVGAGGASSVSFSSIPSTYQHLQIRMIARTNRASSNEDYLNVRFNNDVGTNFAYHLLEGNGSTTSASGLSSNTEIIVTSFSAVNATANIFGSGILDIHDYANTSKYKTTRQLGGVDRNGGGTISLGSGLWLSTNAISSIQITPGGGTLIVQNSTFALYGIKSA